MPYQVKEKRDLYDLAINGERFTSRLASVGAEPSVK